MASEIPLFQIAYDHLEIENAIDSIERGSYWAKGPYVDEFESELESYLGVEHAVTVNSGTSALRCALAAHGIGEGDEVIVPSFTFIATANAVKLAGANPVFADIDRETYGLDPDAVESRIGSATKAILPVHCYGGACRIEELASIAAEHGVPVIEDAAEAFGATVNGAPLGTIGKTGVLSFCQNKVLATGEGGAVVTDDDTIAERARLYRSHGRASESYFEDAGTGTYVSLGANLRMPDVVAAIGTAQLSKVESLIEGRRRVAAWYEAELRDVPSVTPHDSAHGTHVYQLFTVTLDDAVDRASVVETLADEGIASKVYWDPPVHRTEYYRREREESSTLPVTEDVASRVLSLPIHPDLSRTAVERIGSTLRRAVTSARVE